MDEIAKEYDVIVVSSPLCPRSQKQKPFLGTTTSNTQVAGHRYVSKLRRIVFDRSLLTLAGLTECILSGVLSVKGKKVLHIDRNDHYGG